MMNELWEGYDNQEVVVLEDMDPFHVKMAYNIKIWADRYSFRGRVLFGSIVLRPAKFIITSQYTPAEIWDDQKTVDAIMDRFNLIVLERLENFDNTPPRLPKKKPALARTKAKVFNAVKEYCVKCYLTPCMCDTYADMLSSESTLEEIEIEDL